MKYNHKSIWNCEQNKPSLVVDDLMEHLKGEYAYAMTPHDIYEILLNRGVFKWLAIRRDLIKLKNKWKAQITASIAKQDKLNNRFKVHYERGYRAALEDCRAEVRALCHSQRWRAPDNDRRAREWLDQQSQSS